MFSLYISLLSCFRVGSSRRILLNPAKNIEQFQLLTFKWKWFAVSLPLDSLFTFTFMILVDNNLHFNLFLSELNNITHIALLWSFYLVIFKYCYLFCTAQFNYAQVLKSFPFSSFVTDKNIPFQFLTLKRFENYSCLIWMRDFFPFYLPDTRREQWINTLCTNSVSYIFFLYIYIYENTFPSIVRLRDLKLSDLYAHYGSETHQIYS